MNDFGQAAFDHFQIHPSLVCLKLLSSWYNVVTYTLVLNNWLLYGQVCEVDDIPCLKPAGSKF